MRQTVKPQWGRPGTGPGEFNLPHVDRLACEEEDPEVARQVTVLRKLRLGLDSFELSRQIDSQAAAHLRPGAHSFEPQVFGH